MPVSVEQLLAGNENEGVLEHDDAGPEIDWTREKLAIAPISSDIDILAAVDLEAGDVVTIDNYGKLTKTNATVSYNLLIGVMLGTVMIDHSAKNKVQSFGKARVKMESGHPAMLAGTTLFLSGVTSGTATASPPLLGVRTILGILVDDWVPDLGFGPNLACVVLSSCRDTDTGDSSATYSVPSFWTIPQPRNWTVGSTGDFPDLATALADVNVIDGDILSLAAETFTIGTTVTVDKKLEILGQGMGLTILQTPGDGTDPMSLLSITAAGVRIHDLTAVQQKPSATGSETIFSFASTACDFILQRIDMDSMFACLTIASGNFKVDSCSFDYGGPGGYYHQFIIITGHPSGDSEFTNNTFYPFSQLTRLPLGGGDLGSREFLGGFRRRRPRPRPGPLPPYTVFRTTFCYVTGTDDLVGSITFKNNIQQEDILNCFYYQNSFAGGAEGFSLVFEANNIITGGVDICVYGSTDSFFALFKSLTFRNNSTSNANGRGLFCVDGEAPATLGAFPDIIFQNNVLATTTISASGYAPALFPDQGLMGYNTGIFGSPH